MITHAVESQKLEVQTGLQSFNTGTLIVPKKRSGRPFLQEKSLNPSIPYEEHMLPHHQFLQWVALALRAIIATKHQVSGPHTA
jgi:hypothetical protein